MTLSDIDRRLLERCLNNEPNSWEAFIDRYLGLVIHVVHQTAGVRGIAISVEQRDDLVAEVFFTLVHDDFKVLRRFRWQSSLATYLTVVARRVVSPKLVPPRRVPATERNATREYKDNHDALDDRDHLEQLMQRLDPQEADVIRMHHLEGKSYREISDHLGMPENSIGPLLSRAREKMRTTEPTG